MAKTGFRFQAPKYRNKPQTVDGFRFDSKAELHYYGDLLLLQKAGSVLHVDVHPYLTLGPGDRHCVDFLVWLKDGQVQAHDVKGSRETRAASEFRRLLHRWNHPTVELVGVSKDKRGGWERW